MNNKKKLIIAISAGVSVLAVVGIILCILFIAKPFAPKGDGTITVQYANIDGTVIKEKEIMYFEGDTLPDLIADNFENVKFENGMLMNIENFVTDVTTWDPFISIYVDGEMSMVGINDIQFEDGTVITLRLTSFVVS